MPKAVIVKINTKEENVSGVLADLIRQKLLAGVIMYENGAAVYYVAAKGVNKRTIEKYSNKIGNRR